MRKKLISLLLGAVCAVCVVSAWNYIKESGILRKYPDPMYLAGDDAELRPIYGQLTKDEKSIYTALYKGIADMDETIPLPKEIDGNTYSKIFCILEKQESEFFYLDSAYYTAQKIRDAKMLYRRIDDPEQKIKAMSDAVEAAVSGAKGIPDDEGKVRYINDYIVRECSYIMGEDSDFAATVYGCLVEGQANCEGYAKTFNLLARKLGIESVVVTGTTDKGENHAWNQVKIDGEWYNIDVTWADTDIADEVRQMYFLCSDEDFSKTHYADDLYFQPFPCTSDKWNYYIKSGLFADSYEKAEEIVRRELSAGNGTIEIRFSDSSVYEKFRDEFITEDNIFEVLGDTRFKYDEEVTISLKENEKELCMTMLFT